MDRKTLTRYFSANFEISLTELDRLSIMPLSARTKKTGANDKIVLAKGLPINGMIISKRITKPPTRERPTSCGNSGVTL